MKLSDIIGKWKQNLHNNKTFDVVYTKVMLHIQQVLFSQSGYTCLYRDTSCISTNTDVCFVSTTTSTVRTNACCISIHIVVYPGAHFM